MLPSDQPFATLVGEGQNRHARQPGSMVKGAPWGALFLACAAAHDASGLVDHQPHQDATPGSCRSITSSIGPFVS